MTRLIYKQFAKARTVFYALAACALLASPAHANPAYTVEGVEVDVTAKNAVMAREKALNEAQVKAYGMLAERFLTPEELATFKAPDADTVSLLVQDFEVTNEQLSTTRYKGTYTIRFRPNAMKTQMASQGKSYSDVQAKPVLVLPFFQAGRRTTLWSETNPWMKAWRSAPSDKSMLQPTVLPSGDAQDIATVNDEVGLKADPMMVQQLASRYNADDVAILMATVESAGKLAVNIYSNGFEGPVFVRKVTIDQKQGEGEAALYARAAAQVKGLLRQDWKANAAHNPRQPAAPAARIETTVTAAPPYGQKPSTAYTRTALGPSQNYNVQARFASVQDWVRMKGALDRVYGVQAVVIKTLKPREAVMDVRYAGSAAALQTSLQNAGIMMRAGAGGGLEIFLGGSAPSYR